MDTACLLEKERRKGQVEKGKLQSRRKLGALIGAA